MVPASAAVFGAQSGIFSGVSCRPPCFHTRLTAWGHQNWPLMAPWSIWVDPVQRLLWGDEVIQKEKELMRKKISIPTLELLKRSQYQIWL